jgi:cytochrome b
VVEVRDGTRLVWDLPLRMFHWLLVAAIATSWVTHELGIEYFDWHVRAGYVTLVLLAFRIAWGFVGPRHARFAGFLRGPRAVMAYLRTARRGESATTVGHNPLGGWSIVVMLGLLLFQALTGLFSNDEIFNTGPLYGYVSDDQSDGLTRLHKQSFDWLLVFVGLHLAAVAWYQWFKGVDLVRPMLTGRKSASLVPPGEEVSRQRLWLAVVLVALAATALWRVVASAPSASMSFY